MWKQASECPQCHKSPPRPTSVASVGSAEPVGGKVMRLRYGGLCIRCGLPLEKGVAAVYDAVSQTVRCVECPTGFTQTVVAVVGGNAGSSALQRSERMRANREQRIRERHGDLLGGFFLWMNPTSRSAQAWAAGAAGERKLAEALSTVPGVQALHDRRVPRTRGNIDHIVVGPAGVFVVDAKNYRGLIQILDRGGMFSTDHRLYVGRRDCSRLADQMGWQVQAVERALSAAGVGGTSVTPVLCFVDGQWPLSRPPESFKGVRLEGLRSIKQLVAGRKTLDSAAVDRVTRSLLTAFPAK